MAALVETVRGPLEVKLLGPTLMHEHIFVLSTEIQQNYPQTWGDEEARVNDAVTRLNELQAAGVTSLVDLTVLGLGRSISRIARVAEQTNLNIIVATGLYTYNDLPQFFQYRRPRRSIHGKDVLTSFFVDDITKGIANTTVKAAILKCATDVQGMTPDVERVIRAVARAHHATGVPISTHTHAASRSGLDQQRILLEEGVDLNKVIIGHCGDTTDLTYLRILMEHGSTIGMDRFGIESILSFEDRIETVVRLCAEGYSEKMVLSHDAACHNDWLEDDVIRRTGSNWNYLHITKDVIPALRQRGVTEAQIGTMMVDNPLRLLSRVR